MSYIRSLLKDVNCFTCSSNRHIHSDYSCFPGDHSRSYTHLLSSSPLLRSRSGDECVTESFLYINNQSFIGDNLYPFQQTSEILKPNCCQNILR